MKRVLRSSSKAAASKPSSPPKETKPSTKPPPKTASWSSPSIPGQVNSSSTPKSAGVARISPTQELSTTPPPSTPRKLPKAQFPHTLKKLVDDLSQEQPHVVSWIAEGRAFQTNTQWKKLLGSSLERFFRHNKFDSFRRQLGSYGWKRKCYRTVSFWYHPLFHREARPEDWAQLARIHWLKCGKGTRLPYFPDPASPPRIISVESAAADEAEAITELSDALLLLQESADHEQEDEGGDYEGQSETKLPPLVPCVSAATNECLVDSNQAVGSSQPETRITSSPPDSECFSLLESIDMIATPTGPPTSPVDLLVNVDTVIRMLGGSDAENDRSWWKEDRNDHLTPEKLKHGDPSVFRGSILTPISANLLGAASVTPSNLEFPPKLVP